MQFKNHFIILEINKQLTNKIEINNIYLELITRLQKSVFILEMKLQGGSKSRQIINITNDTNESF